MTIAACPACHEHVTLPVGAEPDSVVRCPLCQEECALRDYLAQLPPELIVVDDPSSSDTTPGAWTIGQGVADDTTVAIDNAPADSSKFAWAPEQPAVVEPTDSDHNSDLPAFDFTAGSAPQAAVVAPASRPVRPKKNPIVEMAKVVAGGLLAVPLALLILLWLPGRWQRDPLQIGPSLGRTIPWIVPANLRPYRSALEVDSERSADNHRRPSHPSSSRLKVVPTQEPQVGGTAPGSLPASGASANQNQPQDLSDTAAAPAVPPKSMPSNADNADPEAEFDLVVGVRNATRRTADELHTALEKAVQANVQWDARGDTSPTVEDQLSSQLYAAFAQLGEVITYVDPHGSGVRESVGTVNSLLMSMAMYPKKLAALGNSAGVWLDRKDRDSSGVLLFGTVKRIRLSGQLYETQLELAARQRRTLSVISRVDPKGLYGTKDRLLVLGAIVADPATNLAGYTGKEPLVIMAGFPVPIGR